MLINYTLNTRSLFQIQHIVDRYSWALQDLTPLWSTFETLFAPSNAMKIFTEGQASWAAYKNPYYRRWKFNHGYYLTILRKTGKMYKAFREPGTPGNVSIKNPDSWTYGIDLNEFENEYPKYHMTGTSKMPARPWCYVSDWMKVRMEITFYRYIRSIMTGNPINLGGSAIYGMRP